MKITQLGFHNSKDSRSLHLLIKLYHIFIIFQPFLLIFKNQHL
nr:MAG TPA: hypothetical protein [Caudoviricetes sp.]DAY45046.1 MAG TPA: hypothetical protein [Caudoviricetes sp.]